MAHVGDLLRGSVSSLYPRGYLNANSRHSAGDRFGPGYVALCTVEQVQRSDFGTPASACSMCSPQPAQVGLLQFGQVIRRHMGTPSALHVESDLAIRSIAGDLALTCRHVQTRPENHADDRPDDG